MLDETLAELRRIREDLPVILSSGHTEQHAVRHISGQPTAFLRKPYTREELSTKMWEVLSAGSS